MAVVAAAWLSRLGSCLRRSTSPQCRSDMCRQMRLPSVNEFVTISPPILPPKIDGGVIMAVRRRVPGEIAMATRWRRRVDCVLIVDRPVPASLCKVSGVGAEVETSARPPLGHAIELHHPEAGAIRGAVAGHIPGGLALAFDRGASSVAFALAVITADMSRPA